MLSLEEAKEQILNSVQPLPAEHLSLADAPGRFAAGDLCSSIDLPGFDNSAMDGYAVLSKDLKSASVETPVQLRCISRVAAGEISKSEVSSGECIRIFTGSPLPAGADAVVMQEDVAVSGSNISFSEPIKPLENVRLRGEDLRAGTVLVRKGEKLSATRLGLLAATGYYIVPVHRSCSISLIATGSELREPGEKLAPGEIYESNRSLLAAFLAGMRGTVRREPIVRDTLTSTVSALKSAFESSEVVISTGGVSVGEFDFLKEAFTNIGGKLDLWRISVRPGKPFVFGRYGKKFLFGLPGNPVSAFVTFLLLVRPGILKLSGASNLELPILYGELAEPVRNPSDRRHFMRVRWEDGRISVAGPQASHMIGSLGRANALVDVPPGAQLERGTKVPVLLWEMPGI